jgi:hypothetical protein
MDSSYHRRETATPAFSDGGRTPGEDLAQDFQVESFLEAELDTLQATVERLAACLKDSESEKSALVTQLAVYSDKRGNAEAQLAQRVAELETENGFLREELSTRKGSESLEQPRSLSPSPEGRPYINGGAHSLDTSPPQGDGQHRKDMEWMAREGKLYMWVQFRTRELHKVSQLLANTENRCCEMSKLISKLCAQAVDAPGPSAHLAGGLTNGTSPAPKAPTPVSTLPRAKAHSVVALSRPQTTTSKGFGEVMKPKVLTRTKTPSRTIGRPLPTNGDAPAGPKPPVPPLNLKARR